MTATIDRRLYIKSLQSIFAKNQQFRDIVRQTKQLSKAKTILNEAMPKAISDSLFAYSYENSRLVIGVPNSSILSRFRFYIPELIAIFREHDEFRDLKRIHPKVMISPSSGQLKRREGKLLSVENVSMLKETAASLEEGSLKRAFEKLVQHSTEQSSAD